MTYELAKKLKDAGFPFKHFNYIPNFYSEVSCITNKDGESVGIPLLSELLEACGNDIAGICKDGNGWFSQKGIAFGIRTNSFPTPEEAVANLWLALKDKKEK